MYNMYTRFQNKKLPIIFNSVKFFLYRKVFESNQNLGCECTSLIQFKRTSLVTVVLLKIRESAEFYLFDCMRHIVLESFIE